MNINYKYLIEEKIFMKKIVKKTVHKNLIEDENKFVKNEKGDEWFLFSKG